MIDFLPLIVLVSPQIHYGHLYNPEFLPESNHSRETTTDARVEGKRRNLSFD
jgi:hypothetical protein